jgi:1-phosphofructokinase family hexose kinase
VIVACPNLTLDRTLSLPELRPGEVLRFERVVVTPGGKGVNVARVARELGVPAVLVGFQPGRTGAAALGLLGDEGLEVIGVPVAGEIRAATVVLERSGRVTLLNEPGPPLAPGDWERFEAAVREALAARRARMLVCSGSLPPGAPEDGYARLVGGVRTSGGVAVIDVGGAQLAAALAAGADVVTPNLPEAEGLLHGRADESVEAGDPVEVRSRAEAAAAELVARGARAAVVTAAEAGAAFASEAGVGWHRAPKVAVVTNPIGAGDAFAAGLALALERGEPFEEAVAAGMATGAASVETDTAGLVIPERVAELRAAI